MFSNLEIEFNNLIISGLNEPKFVGVTPVDYMNTLVESHMAIPFHVDGTG